MHLKENFDYSNVLAMQYDLTWAIVFVSMATIAMFLANTVHVLGSSNTTNSW